MTKFSSLKSKLFSKILAYGPKYKFGSLIMNNQNRELVAQFSFIPSIRHVLKSVKSAELTRIWTRYLSLNSSL